MRLYVWTLQISTPVMDNTRSTSFEAANGNEDLFSFLHNSPVDLPANSEQQELDVYLQTGMTPMLYSIGMPIGMHFLRSTSYIWSTTVCQPHLLPWSATLMLPGISSVPVETGWLMPLSSPCWWRDATGTCWTEELRWCFFNLVLLRAMQN